jgi:hypothetical protein
MQSSGRYPVAQGRLSIPHMPHRSLAFWHGLVDHGHSATRLILGNATTKPDLVLGGPLSGIGIQLWIKHVVSVLFWNIAKNPQILPHVRCLGRNYSVDIFLLAECPDDLAPAIDGLNTLKKGLYKEEGNVRPKVRVLSRLHPPKLKHIFTNLGGETAVWSINTSKIHPPEVLLAATHLPAKVGGNTDAGQATDACRVATDLMSVEDTQKHRNTIFVGDFNMNPYDPGMTLVTCFHGLMTAELACEPDRRYRNRRYPRFYNPMWGFLGDRTGGPAGTFFWRSSSQQNTHWGMFDQVLVRPALIQRLSRLEILDYDGEHPLTAADGYPDKKHLSDHLPILFELEV